MWEETSWRKEAVDEETGLGWKVRGNGPDPLRGGKSVDVDQGM